MSNNKLDIRKYASDCQNDFRCALNNSFAKIGEAIRSPTTQIISLIVFVVTALASTAASRAIDYFWEVDPPEHVLKLNDDLRSASNQMKQTSDELKNLASSINTANIDDPVLKNQLDKLDKQLSGLNELVHKTSSQTDKVATISQALRDDWSRLKSNKDRTIDGVPDLVLEVGEGVQLCNGLTSLGVNQMQSSGRVWLTVADKPGYLKSGGRLSISEESFVDYIGNKNGKSLFKVHCRNA